MSSENHPTLMLARLLRASAALPNKRIGRYEIRSLFGES